MLFATYMMIIKLSHYKWFQKRAKITQNIMMEKLNGYIFD